MLQQPFITEVFDGLIVDLFRHDDNPAAEAQYEYLFHDGYFELLITVTESNYCVLPGIYKALLVVGAESLEATSDGVMAIYPINPGEKVLGLSYAIGKAEEVEAFEADILLIHVGTNDNDLKTFAFVIDHDKDGLEINERMQLQ